jgi:hypothetical protein
MKLSEEQKAFEVYASKAVTMYPGPQSKASKAKDKFWHLLTEKEKSHLITERWHGTNEPGTAGKQSFYEECNKIRQRLFEIKK